MTSHISSQAKAAQDSARRQDGKFGNQQHTEATGVTLTPQTVLHGDPSPSTRAQWLAGRHAPANAVNPLPEDSAERKIWDQGRDASAEELNPYDGRPVTGTSDDAYQRLLEEETHRTAHDPDLLRLNESLGRANDLVQAREDELYQAQSSLKKTVRQATQTTGQRLWITGEVYMEDERNALQVQSEVLAERLRRAADLVYDGPPAKEIARNIFRGTASQVRRNSYEEEIIKDLPPETLDGLIEAKRNHQMAERALDNVQARVANVTARRDAAHRQLALEPQDRKDVTQLRQMGPEDGYLETVLAGY